MESTKLRRCGAATCVVERGSARGRDAEGVARERPAPDARGRDPDARGGRLTLASWRAVALANSFGARARGGRRVIRGVIIDGMMALAETPRGRGFDGTGIAAVALDARGLITVVVVVVVVARDIFGMPATDL